MSCDEKLRKRLESELEKNDLTDSMAEVFGVKKPQKSLSQIMEEKRLARKFKGNSILKPRGQNG